MGDGGTGARWGDGWEVGRRMGGGGQVGAEKETPPGSEPPVPAGAESVRPLWGPVLICESAASQPACREPSESCPADPRQCAHRGVGSVLSPPCLVLSHGSTSRCTAHRDDGRGSCGHGRTWATMSRGPGAWSFWLHKGSHPRPSGPVQPPCLGMQSTPHWPEHQVSPRAPGREEMAHSSVRTQGYSRGDQS